MPKYISRGQIRKLSEIHNSRPGGIMPDLTTFATEHGVEIAGASDPLVLLDPLMAIEDQDGHELGDAMQKFIARLASGGLKLSDDIRIRQAKIFWDLRFGEVLGLGSQDWKKYLNGTDSLKPIPQIPAWPANYPAYLDRNILVDKRVLTKVGLEEVCRLLGVSFPGNDNTFEPYEEGRTKSGLYWMRAQDGQRNRDKSPRVCRAKRFASCEVGQEAFEGLSLFAQDREVLKSHYMDLPGSVHVLIRDRCACLKLWHDRPGLGWDWDDFANPDFGSASRVE